MYDDDNLPPGASGREARLPPSPPLLTPSALAQSHAHVPPPPQHPSGHAGFQLPPGVARDPGPQPGSIYYPDAQVPIIGQGVPGAYYGPAPPAHDSRGWVTRADGTKVSPKFEVELNQMYARCQGTGDVFRIWNEHGVMNGINLATGISRLGRDVNRNAAKTQRVRVSYEFRDMLKLLRTKLCDNADWTGARQLANMAHGLAKFDPGNAPRGQDVRGEVAALATLGRAATVKIEQFNTQELANTAWAFATAWHEEPQLFAAIARAAIPRAAQFKPQEISNTLWAFAKLGLDAPPLFMALADVAMHTRDMFNPQNVSNTIWAFAKRKLPHPALHATLGPVAARQARDFSVQALANLVWAFATQNETCPDMFAALGHTCAEKLDAFSPVALADTTWAYCHCGMPHLALLQRVSDMLGAARPVDFTPLNLNKFARSFAAADGVNGFELTTDVAENLARNVAHNAMGPRGVRTRDGTDMLEGLVILRNHVGDRAGDGFMDATRALDQAMARVAREFFPQDLARAATAFSRAGYECPAFFENVLLNAHECFAAHRNGIIEPHMAVAILEACLRQRFYSNEGCRSLLNTVVEKLATTPDAILVRALEVAADLGGLHAVLYGPVARSGRAFAGNDGARALGAFARAGAWYDDYLCAVHANVGGVSDATSEAALREFRFAASVERPELAARLDEAVVETPSFEYRAKLRATLSEDLTSAGWSHAIETDGVAAYADAVDEARTTAALLADPSREVRDVRLRACRPNGASLFAARLLLKAGWRIEFLGPPELLRCRGDADAAAALAARLRGVEPPAKKPRVREMEVEEEDDAFEP